MQFQGIAIRATAVTPSDATIVGPTIGLYVGTTGDVVVQMITAATNVTFEDVPAGTWMPISVRKVMAATTASGIVALTDS